MYMLFVLLMVSAGIVSILMISLLIVSCLIVSYAMISKLIVSIQKSSGVCYGDRRGPTQTKETKMDLISLRCVTYIKFVKQDG
jgi:hypothetical protein